MTKGLTMRLIPALMMVGFAGVAGASGFALQNQNGSGNGNAFAGAAAAAEDAGTIFFNPAGMTYLPEGHSISLAATVLQRSVEYSDTGTAALAAQAIGTNGGQAGGVKLIPAGYYSYSINPNFRVGLGISPTFGNKTEFSSDFIGRFSGFMSEMKQININPSFAVKLNEMVSLGFGINYAINETEFRQMAATGASTQAIADLRGSDATWGYNLGAMFQISPSTRIGVSYRSALSFNLKGMQEVSTVNRMVTAEGLKMPDTFSMAVSQKLSDRWEMLGDATWTGWDKIQSLDVFNAATGAKITTLDYKFRNTWRVGLGANYKYNDAWKLKFGVAFDQTPVRDATNRTMTLPDSNRTWLSVGARYTLSKASSLDVGYSHIFFAGAPTARVASTAVGSQTINGKFDTSANLLSAQYNHSF